MKVNIYAQVYVNITLLTFGAVNAPSVITTTWFTPYTCELKSYDFINNMFSFIYKIALEIRKFRMCRLTSSLYVSATIPEATILRVFCTSFTSDST